MPVRSDSDSGEVLADSRLHDGTLGVSGPSEYEVELPLTDGASDDVLRPVELGRAVVRQLDAGAQELGRSFREVAGIVVDFGFAVFEYLEDSGEGTTLNVGGDGASRRGRGSINSLNI